MRSAEWTTNAEWGMRSVKVSIVPRHDLSLEFRIPHSAFRIRGGNADRPEREGRDRDGRQPRHRLLDRAVARSGESEGGGAGAGRRQGARRGGVPGRRGGGGGARLLL